MPSFLIHEYVFSTLSNYIAKTAVWRSSHQDDRDLQKRTCAVIFATRSDLRVCVKWLNSKWYQNNESKNIKAKHHCPSLCDLTTVLILVIAPGMISLQEKPSRKKRHLTPEGPLPGSLLTINVWAVYPLHSIQINQDNNKEATKLNWPFISLVTA